MAMSASVPADATLLYESGLRGIPQNKIVRQTYHGADYAAVEIRSSEIPGRVSSFELFRPLPPGGGHRFVHRTLELTSITTELSESPWQHGEWLPMVPITMASIPNRIERSSSRYGGAMTKLRTNEHSSRVTIFSDFASDIYDTTLLFAIAFRREEELMGRRAHLCLTLDLKKTTAYNGATVFKHNMSRKVGHFANGEQRVPRSRMRVHTTEDIAEYFLSYKRLPEPRREEVRRELEDQGFLINLARLERKGGGINGASAKV